MWLGTLVAAAVATALLQLAIWYVDDPGRSTSLEAWRFTAWRAAGIHGLVSLAYWIWPKKAPKGSEESVRDAAGAERDRVGR